MNGERRLKTVFFCLGDEWKEAARELAEALRQSGVRTGFLKKEEGRQLVLRESAKELRQALVMTDEEALARHLKAHKIACVGCAGMEYGYFAGAGMVTDAPGALGIEELEEYLFHFHGWPVTVAVTKRLILREITEADAGKLYQISTQECMRYLQDTMEKNFFQRENLYFYIKEAYRLQGYGLWSVLKKDGTLIGCCGLADVAVEDAAGDVAVEDVAKEDAAVEDAAVEGTAAAGGQRRLELQYMLDERFQRKGYGLEMCQAVLNYVFARTDRDEVWLRVHPENHASLRLAEKLGFCYEKVQASGRSEMRYLRKYI